jgi:hypothetical protein
MHLLNVLCMFTLFISASPEAITCVTFLLDQKSNQKNQEPNMLLRATPTHPRIWLGPAR